MRILYGETNNKSIRSFLSLTKEEVLRRIEADHGYHEVIPMIDNNVLLRVYIDTDLYGTDPQAVLEDSLQALNAYFKTTDSDWAICSCNRPDGDQYKISYHIISKVYCMKLEDMRKAGSQLKARGLHMDESVYWFDLNDHEDNAYLRLPNQTKHSINKPAPPLIILQGELSDFLVTDVSGLQIHPP